MTTTTGTRVWKLSLPAPTIHVPHRKTGQPKPPGGWPNKPAAGWLTMNGDKGSWRAKHRLTTEWRNLATTAAMTARLPRGDVQRARFDVALRFARGGRRDPINWHPTCKAVIDALTSGTKKHPGWGFLPDDAPRFLHCEDCPHIRIGTRLPVVPLGPLGVLELTITDLSDGNDA
ncbi:hypothetical protein QQG74_09890 [Micromonospora sp. FIMYZ51]|uniref:hypothetical protein n=1 Tax=Micromonospora sp. FIMYZ51 TaxID=3051832 RepID=UPI00311FEA6E